MGGLHLSMNFLKAIGQHMADCGLSDMWVESGLMAIGSVTKALEGKAYGKAMRAHKLTFQALRRIFMPLLMEHVSENEGRSAEVLKGLQDKDPSSVLEVIRNACDESDIGESKNLQQHLKDFIKARSEMSDNFSFWWSYVEMVQILLNFTRSMRDGIWDLYLWSLSAMLPYLARYDHSNYHKSLTIYIAEMHMLPKAIEDAFRDGDFVVKNSNRRFNQVDADHAQEWLVGTCKEAGGITGITNDNNTLQRWALSFHWRSELRISRGKPWICLTCFIRMKHTKK